MLVSNYSVAIFLWLVHPMKHVPSRGWRKAENNFVPAGLRTVMALALPAGGRGGVIVARAFSPTVRSALRRPPKVLWGVTPSRLGSRQGKITIYVEYMVPTVSGFLSGVFMVFRQD
jgi:hypothetical protein